MPTSRVRELRITKEVRPLLAQLDEARSVAAKHRKNKSDAPSTSSSSSVIDKLIENISGEIHFIADIFRRLEIWERDMKGKMGDIAKELNKALEDGNNQNEFQSKLLTVEEKVSGFKETMINTESPLRLECLEAYAKSESTVAPSADFSSPLLTSTESAESLHELYQFDTSKSVAEFEKDIEEVCSHTMDFVGLMWFLLFFSILPVGSLLKKSMIDLLFASRFLFWNARTIAKERLSVLEGMSIIKCVYKDHNILWDIDSCMMNPSAHQAMINLAYRNERIKDIALGIYDPLSVCPSLLVEEHQGVPRYCVNAKHHMFLKMKDAEILTLGRWHSSPKHHIEVENIEFLN